MQLARVLSRPSLVRAPTRVERFRAGTMGPAIVAHAALAAVAGIGAWVAGISPVTQPPWLPTKGAEAFVSSSALGLATGALVVIATQRVVRHTAWGRALGEALRPRLRGESDVALLVLALVSAASEELFFRGLLSPLLGVVLSSLAFGLPHHTRGTGGFVWLVSATLLGAWLAAIYGMTGHLVGPVLAHALINTVNFRRVRDGASR